MCVYTVALMKTCVQLISPVYLRMCSDECCCRAVFILYTFYLSVSLSIPHSISLSPSLPLSHTLSVFHSAHRRPFFSYLYTENRATAR